MLVPIQFPRDFVVAYNREIEKRNLEPWIERPAFAMHGIEMPVDIFSSTVEDKFEIFVAQQTKAVITDLICLAKNFRDIFRQIFVQQIRTLEAFSRGKKERSRTRRRSVECGCPVVDAHPVHQQISPFVEFLPDTHAPLFPIHSRYARELALQSGSHRCLILHAKKADLDQSLPLQRRQLLTLPEPQV